MKKLLLALSLSIAVSGLAAACAPSLAPAPSGAPAKKLVIAVQPTATAETLSKEAKDIEQFLEAKLGVDVEIVFPTTFAGVIEALRFGHAQAAFMSAWPSALAEKYAGAQVVLAEVREVVIDDKKVEEPFYYSYWVVRKDSPVASLQELRGQKVSLPSPLSTSGYVAPLARLVELGLIKPDGSKEADPKQFFGDVLLSGGYAQSWEALKSGQVAATVIAGDVAEKLYREILENTRVVEKQGPIPSHAVVFSKDLADPLRSQLQSALLELGNPDQRALMRKFISGIFVGFKPTTNEEHLASLNRYLSLTQFQFVERLR